MNMGSVLVTVTASVRPSLTTRPASALGPQVHVGDHPTPEDFVPVTQRDRPDFRKKPVGGLWTSSLVNGGSDWIRWCRAEDFGGVDVRDWWVLNPISDRPVLVVDGWDALDAIVARYGIPIYRNIRPDWQEHGFDFGRIIADGYVGLHLADQASWKLHHRRYGLNGDDMNTWDCESTVWFEWVFDEAVQIPRTEHQEADAA